LKAEVNSHLLAVMFVDLGRFKFINDTLGHQTGDYLLQQVVQRLKNCIKGEDLIARWGSDEFTLLLPKISDLEAIKAIAQKILDTLKYPFQINNRLIHIIGNVGVAVYPEHGQDAETLLKNADAALSQAQKYSHHNYQYYNPTLNSQAYELLTLENLLHSALKNEELLLYYQPIVNLNTGKIAKMEALLRWQNPQLGLVPPYVFIPLAEENGLIISIGEWVIKTACSQNKIWQNMGLPPIKVSVNLSVRQFQQKNLTSTIVKILEQTKLAPDYLELEITESITMKDTESAKSILTELNHLGIALSMDDFGTGYSSLGYLKQFPFNTLKIDRSFIKDLHSSSQDIAIVSAIITLGQGLNLNVVAEGVETEELKYLLKTLGCEYIQGYLFSKPLPAAEATKLLASN
jgi:diguanylate cyclase (GGDEF)-like protein